MHSSTSSPESFASHFQGSTGLLTRGMVDRDMFYGHAMILAMGPFINPALY